MATQSVGLPRDKRARTNFCDFRQHRLESRLAFLGAGYGRIPVLLNDGQPVSARSRMGKLLLPVDTRLVMFEFISCQVSLAS